MADLDFSSIDFVHKATSAHLADSLNKKTLIDPEPLERLIEAAEQQSKQSEFVVQPGIELFLQRARRLREGKEFVENKWPEAVLAQGKVPVSDLRQVNRWIIETLYSKNIEERTKASYALCWQNDQITRLCWAVGALLLFLVFGFTVDVNATSLHGFYRKKMEDEYVVQETSGELMHEMNTTKKGGPYHILCATLNLFDAWPWRTTEYQSAYTFYFSRFECGSQALPGRPASTDQYCGGQIDVATAAAISGAAFSPALLKNPLLFCMTMLLNLRLGQWLPNPSKPEMLAKPRKVTMINILRDFLPTIRAPKGDKRPDKWNYCFVSDGGHNDNLAMSPLLFRQNRLVMLSDATQDPEFNFPDFLKALRRYRSRGNMRFRKLDCWNDLREHSHECINLAPLRPKTTERHQRELREKGIEESSDGRRISITERSDPKTPARSERHFVLSKFTFPNGKDWSVIIYIKSTMTGDEEADLKEHQVLSEQFPHDPTTDQFFTEPQVESYRQLGNHIGLELCDVIQNGMQILGLDNPELDDKYRFKHGLWDEACQASEACPFLVEDLVWILLLGYFEGDLPNDADSLLELLKRSRNVDLSIKLMVRLANHGEKLTTDQMARAVEAVERHIMDPLTQRFSTKLQTLAKDAMPDLFRGDISAIRFLQFWDRVLRIISAAKLSVPEIDEFVQQNTKVRADARERASTALQAMLTQAVNAFEPECKLSDDTLQFLLHMMETVEFDVGIELFGKIAQCRLRSVESIGGFISAMCRRMNQMFEEDRAKLQKALVKLKCIGEQHASVAEQAGEISDESEFPMIDYLMLRLTQDREFPEQLNEDVRKLLREDLLPEKFAGDFDVDEVQVGSYVPKVVERFFGELSKDTNAQPEDFILLALGEALRQFKHAFGRGIKVAFVWRKPGNDKELYYTFYQPHARKNRKKTMSKNFGNTLASRSLDESDARAYFEADIAKTKFKEPLATRGTVATCPCPPSRHEAKVLGALHVSCGRILNVNERDLFKEKVKDFAVLCGYAFHFDAQLHRHQ